MTKEIEDYRKEIDLIDRKIVSLLQKRGKLALLIGKIKSKNGLPVCDKRREKEIFENIMRENEILPDEKIVSIFREIIGSCRKIEEEGMEK
jgi:chorismate mutase